MNFDDKNIIQKSNKAIVTNQLPEKNNNIAITSLVLGIVSIIFCWAVVYPIITRIIGVIAGCVSLMKKRDGSNMAIAGIVLSIVGLLIGMLFLILYIIGSLMN